MLFTKEQLFAPMQAKEIILEFPAVQSQRGDCGLFALVCAASLRLMPSCNYAHEKLCLVTLDMKLGSDVVETEVIVRSRHMFACVH